MTCEERTGTFSQPVDLGAMVSTAMLEISPFASRTAQSATALCCIGVQLVSK